MIKVLKIRNFRYAIFGHIFSFGASNLLQFVISLYILSVTNSALAFSLSLAIIYFSQIITLPIAGVVGDRVDRKRMIVGLDLLNSLFIIGLAIIVFTKVPFHISLIYVVIALIEIIEIFYNTTMHGVMPLLLEEEELDDGNRLKESIDTVIGVISPFLATLLFASIKIHFILFIIGVMYAICGLFELKMKLVTPIREKVESKGLIKNFVSEFMEGVHYIKDNKVVKSVLAVGVTLNFFVAALILGSIYYVIDKLLNLNDFYIALYQIVQSCIILISLTYIAPKIKVLRFKRLTKYVFAIISFLLSIIAFVCYKYTSGTMTVGNSFVIIIIAASLAFTILVMFSVRFNTIIQQNISESLISRVRSSMHIIYVCVMPLGMFLVGVILDNLGVVRAVGLYAIVFSLVASIILLKIEDIDI